MHSVILTYVQPVRFGVFVISLLSLVFSALGAFALLWTLNREHLSNLIRKIPMFVAKILSRYQIKEMPTL